MNDIENKELENAASLARQDDAEAALAAEEADYGRARPADEPGEYTAAIPWRNMPSLPSSEPLVAGVLMDEADSYFEAEAAALAELPPVSPAPTDLVLGVKFSQYGPVYFFTAGELNPQEVQPGKMVLVDTEQGVALAEVVTARRLRLPLPKIRTEEGLEVEIKPIKSLAGPEDIAAAADNRILAAGARMFCKGCIRERNLDMKLVEVEVLHDRSKIIFYFTAPTRIDFRELVKDLVRNYHTRIELRQIGVRHETQMIGALGNCGMTCCCRRYLRKFAPVTIKMAKEQNLFLNPAKLSGMCGRLLCCLSYEQENYDEFHKRSPKIGKKYQTDNGIVKVMRANLFRQSIFVLDEANQESEFQLEEWEALHPVRYDQPNGQANGQSNSQAGGQNGAPEGERRGERPERSERPDRADRPEKPRKAERGSNHAADRVEAQPGHQAETEAETNGEAAQNLPDAEVAPHQAGQNDPLEAVDYLALEEEAGQNNSNISNKKSLDFDDDEGDGSIFGLPGSRYARPAAAKSAGPEGRTEGKRPRPPHSGNSRPENGRRNENKPGNRHKPSKKGRNPE